MNALTKYLDAAKQVTGSDTETAKKIGVGRTTISVARKSGAMRRPQINRLAYLLHIHPGQILYEIDAEAETDPVIRDFLNKKGKEISGRLITGFLGFFALAPLLPELITRGLYIMLSRRPTPAA